MEQQEPSMEEILSSIRRILSHEENTSITEQDELKNTVSIPALEGGEPDSDVMELTQDMRVDLTEEKKEEKSNVISSVPEDMVLLSEDAVRASTDRLTHFVESVSKVQMTEPKSVSTTSLEELVTSLLRPYLKQWLDENLPNLVEKVVQKEVQRLTKNIK